MSPPVTLRCAGRADLPYLTKLGRHPEVEPFLAPGAGTAERLEAILAQAEEAGGPCGLFVVAGGGERLGGVALQLVSRHSRICELTRLMIDPGRRRVGIGGAAVRLAVRRALVEHRFHRVQAETYGDNLAGQRLFERAGFVREGVRRRAYWRRDRWLDGVLYGIVADELGELGRPEG
jgi:RimJ/RimL family protein N-acetyltransferase